MHQLPVMLLGSTVNFVQYNSYRIHWQGKDAVINQGALGRFQANVLGQVFVAAEDEGGPALKTLFEHIP
jgi:hypothetical protein